MNWSNFRLLIVYLASKFASKWTKCQHTVNANELHTNALPGSRWFRICIICKAEFISNKRTYKHTYIDLHTYINICRWPKLKYPSDKFAISGQRHTILQPKSQHYFSTNLWISPQNNILMSLKLIVCGFVELRWTSAKVICWSPREGQVYASRHGLQIC